MADYKRLLAVLLTLLSYCETSSTAEPVKPIAIVEYGKQFAPRTLPTDDQWSGLFCSKLECEIRKANVTIASSSVKHIDDELVDIETANVDGNPLALFHGLPLREGKVVSWFVAGRETYRALHYSQLQKLGRWQMPWGNAPLTISWVKLPEYGGFRYHVSDGATKQFLFRTELEGHYGGETAPYIYWVGDLDGDGNIDILLGLPDDNCGFDNRLYLSSLAPKGQILGKAAQFSGREAACGC